MFVIFFVGYSIKSSRLSSSCYCQLVTRHTSHNCVDLSFQLCDRISKPVWNAKLVSLNAHGFSQALSFSLPSLTIWKYVILPKQTRISVKRL